MTRNKSNVGPQVGQTMKVRGILCRITKIRAAGTLDVESVCWKYAFRVSGLPF